MATQRRQTGRGKDLLVLAVVIAPVFFGISYVSNMQKALIASVTMFAFWVVISERWESRKRADFWPFLTLLGVAHLIAIWLVPMEKPFKPALAVALPFGVVDGLALYWIMGWWLSRGAD